MPAGDRAGSAHRDSANRDSANRDSANRDSARCTIATVSLGPQQCWLAAGGELDLAAAGQLESVLAQQRESGRRFVRLDLSAVTFLDCSCLGVLVGAHHRFLDAHSTLVLTGVRPGTARLLTLAGVDQTLFTIAMPELPGTDAGSDFGAGPDQDTAAAALQPSRIATVPRAVLEAPAELDRALGIIMARRDCTATEAAEALDTLSHSTNRPASEVAHSILKVAARRRWRPANVAANVAAGGGAAAGSPPTPTLPAPARPPAALPIPARARSGTGRSRQPRPEERADRVRS